MTSNDKNIWNYLFVAWIFIWISGATALILIYDVKIVSGIGLLVLPLILCGFFIPVFLSYGKTNFSIADIKKAIFTVNPKRPKTIHYFCIFAIPLTVIFIIALIFSPNQFLEYGPIYNQEYSYGLAFFQLLCLIVYVGYWNLKNWGFFLYIFAVILRVWILNFRLDTPISIHNFTWDIFVIICGAIVLMNNKKLKS